MNKLPKKISKRRRVIFVTKDIFVNKFNNSVYLILYVNILFVAYTVKFTKFFILVEGAKIK